MEISFVYFCCVMSQSIIVREYNFVLIFNLVKNTKIKKSLNVIGLGVDIELLVKPRQCLTEFLMKKFYINFC